MEKIVCSIAFRDNTWKPGNTRHPIVFYEVEDYLIEVDHKPTPLELIQLLPELFGEYGARVYWLRDVKTKKKLFMVNCSQYDYEYPINNPLRREKMMEYANRNPNATYRILNGEWVHEKNLPKNIGLPLLNSHLPDSPPLTRSEVESYVKHEVELFRLRLENESLKSENSKLIEDNLRLMSR